MRQFAATMTSLLFSACAGAAEPPANPDPDLATIPQAALSAPAPARSVAPGSSSDSRIFLESALTSWAKQNNILVPAPGVQPTLQERLSLDISQNKIATPTLRFGFSDRLNAFAQDGFALSSSESLRNDLREAFASVEMPSQTFVEVGRIVLRNGPALGYNPTDFFRSRTQVNLASIDPSASRQNRLGVLMVQGQKLFDSAAVTVAFAPEVQHASPPVTLAPAPFDPRFGQTNSSTRCLGSVDFKVAGLNPQVLVFHDEIGTHFGADLSCVVSNSVVGYAEWSGCDSGALSRRAIAFGQITGTLPTEIPLIPQSSIGTRFQNDVAVGASWTSSYRLTLNLEFHYHQSGFTETDFDRWISLGRSNRAAAQELWFIREYAMDQQEPLIQRQVFVRVDWQDAFVRYLNLGLVSFVNPFDGSSLTQLSAQYAVSRRWTLGMYVGQILGGQKTEKGSVPWSTNAVFQIVRYF